MKTVLAIFVLVSAWRVGAQETAAAIESKMRELQSQRAAVEKQMVVESETLDRCERERHELRDQVAERRVLVERLARYEAMIRAKHEAWMKARAEREEHFWAIFSLRRPQTHIPAAAAAAWEARFTARTAMLEQVEAINAELQKSVPVDAMGNPRRFENITEFARYVGEAKVATESAVLSDERLGQVIDRSRAMLPRLEARSHELRVAIDRLKRELADAQASPPPPVAVERIEPAALRPVGATSPDSPIQVIRPGKLSEPIGSEGGRDIFIFTLRIEARVPVPGPGVYRLRVTVEQVGERFLWSRVKEGVTSAYFQGEVPLPSGPFVIALDVPELPAVAAREIRGTMAGVSSQRALSFPKLLDQLAKDKAKLEAALPREQAMRREEVGTTLLVIARAYLQQNRPGLAMSTCSSAAGFLERKASLGTGFGSADYGDLHMTQAAAAFQAGEAAGVQQAMMELARLFESQASGGAQEDAKLNWMRAADVYLLLGQRRLMLGATPEEARAMVQAAAQCCQRAGRSVPETQWLP